MGRKTCRTFVLEAILRLESRNDRDVFDLSEIVQEVEAISDYPLETIRTQIVSVMCADAPVHHANHTDDVERVDRGRYRLTASGRAAAGAPEHSQPESVVPAQPAVSTSDSMAPGGDWFWEGNVQAVIATNLEREGWVVQRQADTASREPGADIVATRSDEMLVVEVKGYPSTVYARGARAGQPKPTQPATQARVWFASGLMSGMLLRSTYPRAAVLLGFPDFPTYRNLADRVSRSLEELGIGLQLVAEPGHVQTVVAPRIANDDVT